MKSILFALMLCASVLTAQDKPTVFRYESGRAPGDAQVKVYDVLQQNGYTVTHYSESKTGTFIFIQAEKLQGSTALQSCIYIKYDSLKVSIQRENRTATPAREYPQETEFNENEKVFIADIRKSVLKE